ncbi:MAG: hypothetical protein DRH11_16200 [Deltaproteobacteria bacterium]|nr:MAG: hypothetical protein DRH11_16200 [Deltaproteobacteria bacterium]
MPQEESLPSRWEILARERNSRVIMCNSPDTYVLADLAKAADRVMRALRNRFTTATEGIEVAQKVQEFYDIILTLHYLIDELATRYQIHYRPPRTVKRLLKAQEGGNGDGDRAKQDQEADDDLADIDKTRLS